VDIAELLAQAGFSGYPAALMGQPEAEVCDQRGRLQLTGSEAFFGGTAPDGCLDSCRSGRCGAGLQRRSSRQMACFQHDAVLLIDVMHHILPSHQRTSQNVDVFRIFAESLPRFRDNFAPIYTCEPEHLHRQTRKALPENRRSMAGGTSDAGSDRIAAMRASFYLMCLSKLCAERSRSNHMQ
jgi:hypothetical protein